MSRPRGLTWRWRARHWRRSLCCTDAEITVLRALLPAGDPRSDLLLMQAKDAPGVRRWLLDVNTYRLTIPYIRDEAYAIDVREELISPSLRVVDLISGRELTFTVKVLCGGALNDLVGIAQDGLAWPMQWQVPKPLVREPAKAGPVNWLPPTMTAVERHGILQKLATWCWIDVAELRSCRESLLQVRKPASSSDVARAEDRLGMRLPSTYREFASISEGVAIRHGRPYDIFGTSDVYRIDRMGSTFLVVTNLYEAGVVAIDVTPELGESVVLLGPDTSVPEVIGSLRVHVRDSLQWAARIDRR